MAAAPAKPSPINDHDVEDWKTRFNDVLARPSEHINSKSPPTAAPWHNSFFACLTPIDTCLLTYCLPCVTFGRTHHRLRKDGSLEGYEPINTSCLLFCGAGCFGAHWIPMAMQRADIRAKYNLQGNCLTDIATACCCALCDLVQVDKEAAFRASEVPAGPQGVQQQYVAPAAGMEYPAPAEVKN
ncbi:PLAC8 family-domain-containing protein [Lasiosphaeria miniovina]|uniref:PLAC8 family-domain-containing protein n=1 Tax=Lasiosphaeria miniovina TaxID=1954250 RepID=A0AA40A4W2_9PEZI|nr:PLAC8 family-domain-containing protein [Lasiosphaeria miniovina]KAK0709349.1 PLAC8 family-domain-containing protein [Lasiosphaeria miniovina]